jgi:hypothetical protein
MTSSDASLFARYWGRVLVVVILAGVLGSFIVLLRTRTEGSLWRSGVLGSTVFQPVGCTSGQHAGFFGAELEGKDGSRLRVVRDPAGVDSLLLTLGPATGTPTFVTVARDSCTRFDVEVTEGNFSSNRIRAIDISVAVECSSLRGVVRGKNCL